MRKISFKPSGLHIFILLDAFFQGNLRRTKKKSRYNALYNTILYHTTINQKPKNSNSYRDVIVVKWLKGVDCRIGVSEFELSIALLRSLSDKYPQKGYIPHCFPSYGLNSTTSVLLKDSFGSE